MIQQVGPLSDLGSAGYWRERARDGTVSIYFVLASGRAVASAAPHLALSTDGLFLPEIAVSISELCKSAGLSFECRSILDIDFYERVVAQSPDPVLDANLLLVGTADVNLGVQLLFDKEDPYKELGAGFVPPYDSPRVHTCSGQRFILTNGLGIGVLASHRQPWAEGLRSAIVCAGLFAVGSIAALSMAHEYMSGHRSDENLTDQRLPLRVVRGIPRDYELPLDPVDLCSPPMDVRSLQRVDIVE